MTTNEADFEPLTLEQIKATLQTKEMIAVLVKGLKVAANLSEADTDEELEKALHVVASRTIESQINRAGNAFLAVQNLALATMNPNAA